MEMSFGWDDEVEESSFELCPDGDYRFTVTNFEKGYWEPKKADSKIPACNEARMELTIEWTDSNGQKHTNRIQHRLKLVRNLQFLIYQFFECIGLRKKGDGSTKMPWNDAVGKTGICEVGHHSANGQDYNDIVRCYTPDAAPTVVKNDISEDIDFSL